MRLNSLRAQTPAIPALLIVALLLTLSPLTMAQETSSGSPPTLVVSGFATILSEPDLESTSLGRPDQPELTITGISADGAFYRVDFQGQDGWVHKSDVLEIKGNLDDVPVVRHRTVPAPRPRSVEPPSVEVGNQLHDYDKGWSSAVSELQKDGIIPKGGSLVFEEDYAFFSGRGDFFVSLGRQRPETDFIMAGEIKYDVGTETEYENCALLSRLQPNENGPAENFLEVGLDNDHDVTFFDRFGPGDINTNYDYVEANVDLSVPHHLMILALDNQLTVYLDGEMVVSNFEIAERAGIYGIGLHGRGVGSRCEGRNIWVYQVPYAPPGVCEIRAEGPVNMRSGPGTSFDRAGRLTAGTTKRAQAATIGDDGFIWFQIEDGRWVRNDVIEAFGDCQNLPGPGDRPRI